MSEKILLSKLQVIIQPQLDALELRNAIVNFDKNYSDTLGYELNDKLRRILHLCKTVACKKIWPSHVCCVSMEDAQKYNLTINEKYELL